MKEKIIGVLGGFGYIVYLLLSIFISTLPIVMIHPSSFLVSLLLIFIMMNFPIITPIFWIWGLVGAIKGPQDIFAIIYYVSFVVLFLPFFISSIGSFLSIFKKDNY